MFAIVQTGGKQYRVEPNIEIAVEKIEGEKGDKINLDEVLMTDKQIGAPFVKGASVEAQIIRQAKTRKIFIFKKKRRQNYRRRGGHRQQMTWLKISKINS